MFYQNFQSKRSYSSCLRLSWPKSCNCFQLRSKICRLVQKGLVIKGEISIHVINQKMVKPLYILLLIALVYGQTPRFARKPDYPYGQQLPVWADYSYRVSNIYQVQAKYLDHDLDSQCGALSFSMTMSQSNGLSRYYWPYIGGSPTFGYGSCHYWQYDNLYNYELISSVTYYKTTSPTLSWYRMSAGIVLKAISGQTWVVGTGGSIYSNLQPIPGPIMGIFFQNSGGDDSFQDKAMWTIHDLAWCQNEQIPSFEIISGTYGYIFTMGTTVTIPVDHTYHSWNFYSTYCQLKMKTLSITHRIHEGETNLSMDYLKIRLWNEQAWMLVNVGTTPKFQILPQRDTCLHNIDDCLPIEELGDKCVVVNPNTQVVSASLPPQWTPNCNQDMTLSNRTDSDSVITYAQNPLSDNRRGIVKFSTVDPWMEGIHTMRLRIYNAGTYYLDTNTNLPWIQTDMTQDIQFRVRHNCLLTFIQYNTTYKTYGGKIQDMTVPVSTKQYQDLLPCFSHTYAYRWPPNACNIGFEITSGNLNVMTLVQNVLTVSTTNPLDAAVWPFQIKVFIKEAPSIQKLETMKVTITPPCNIVSYIVFTPIAKDIRYVIGLFDAMPLEFSFTFLNTPCDLWQSHWFTVTDITTGIDITEKQNFLTIQQDSFPVESPKYPRLVVLSHLIADRGTYLVKVYAKLDLSPPFYSQDFITFTLTMDIDKCLLTKIDDQVFADQTFKIDLNAPPVTLVYKQFEDWVTRDTRHPCGPRKYQLSSIAGGGVTGKYLPSPRLLPAVPNLINFLSNDAQTCVISIQTTDPYALGVYTVQLIISLENFPLYYEIQKLVKTFTVTITSVCSQTEILYSTFPLLLQKVAFTVPVTATTFKFNPIPDLMSSINYPNDGVGFCGERAYSGFRVTCEPLITVPAALITYPGTVFTLNPVTFMYVKQNPDTDTTFTVDSRSQAPNYRSYWGLYTIYFSVGFLHYPTFLPKEFFFPAQIVPDCQKAIITGVSISNLPTFIYTPFVSTNYALSTHDEYNAYNYYCDNGISTGGITHTLLDGAGNVYVQTYLTMAVTTLGVTLTVYSNDPAAASAVPYEHFLQSCLTYYPTNCIKKFFTVTLNSDCVVTSYNSINVPKLQETYQVGQVAQAYPITFVTELDAGAGSTTCVYLYHFKVMVDGLDRTNNMPAWLTITLTQMVISSSSSADVGKYAVKIYSFLDKIPVFPQDLNTQVPTELEIEIMSNPCINTRIQQTIEGKAFSYTITYNTFPIDFINAGHTDTVTVSGAANCGQILYTVTDITGADYSPYMKFSVNGRTNTVTFSVSTKDASFIGVHSFKVHASLQQFPALETMLGLDNFLTITIASSCFNDVIYRPMELPVNIKTTIDSPQMTSNFQFVQDSISTNAGFTDLKESGGLCGPWTFDIRVGNFYKKGFTDNGAYVLQVTSPEGLAIVTPGRSLIINGKSDTKFIGKQQIFITVTSSVYPMVTNDFEVMIWVYSYCSSLFRPLSLPDGWKPTITAIQGGDSKKVIFPEWKISTDQDYSQDWGASYDYICGPRKFLIQTSSTVAAPGWITSSQEKNTNLVGYFVQVVVYTLSAKDVGDYKLEYCAQLTIFDNKQCKIFSVIIHPYSYLTTNTPPQFVYKGIDKNGAVQIYGKGNDIIQGLITCSDKETPDFTNLDVKLSMSTTDSISPDIWKIKNYLGEHGGLLYWQTTPEDDGKQFSITIECSDGQYTKSSTVNFAVVYKVKEVNQEEKDLNSTATNLQNKPEVETQKLDSTSFAGKINAKVQVGGRNYTLVRPTVYIKSIDSLGLVTLRFSEDMVFTPGVDTDDVIMKRQLRLDYISGFYGDENGWDKNLKNYKWVVTSVEKREMKIQVTWKAPGWISQGSGFDKLSVTFLEAGAFVNNVRTSIQDEKTFTSLEYFLRAQIDRNAKSTKNTAAMGKSLGAAGSTLVCSGMAMTVIMGVGMAEIWGMINGVQLLIFSPALRLKMPANTQLLIGQIITLATFDYIPMDIVFQKQFDLSNYEPINPYLNSVGLSTSWFILNLGSAWLFLALAVIGLLLLPILSAFSKKTGLLKRQVASLKGNLMWSYFILFMTSMSLEISLSSLIQYQSLVWKLSSSDETGRKLKTEDGSTPWPAEIISVYSAIVVGGVFAIFFVTTPVFFYRNFRNLDHPVVKEPWGAIYTDVKIEKWSLMYPNIAMAKRILFAVILLYLSVNGFIQVLVLQYISIFCLIYLNLVRPMSNPVQQLFEVVNEVMVILLSYALMMFNDYLDPDQRENMGWYLSFVIGIYLACHISRLGIKKFQQLIKTIRDRCFKWQINRLMAARQKLLISQLKASNKVEPEIELPGRSPSLSNLKIRERKSFVSQDENQISEIPSGQPQIRSALSQAEKGQLAPGFQKELTHDADAGVFNTEVIYHINQPFDQKLDLTQTKMNEEKNLVESENMSSVSSLAVESSDGEVQFKPEEKATQSWFIIPDMPNDDIL